MTEITNKIIFTIFPILHKHIDLRIYFFKEISDRLQFTLNRNK